MQNYVGCDISKQWLDFFDEASGRFRQIDNQADAIAAYVAGLCPGRDFIVMEATGVHDRLLRHALAKAGIAFSRHNPAHTTTMRNRRDGAPRPIVSTPGC
ncbi:hypothetical protein RFN29_35405 [Mesorhizobium sp. VK22B]|uniref:Transposase IS111A/IS1328/IS1533 N-terminal domain-containing protein n=2 Tax=Mesorhizobium captivum TaxID=3072319 RepID=A0ABU4ZBX0_9HYPH|nr:hypothetical protein [Mesorhizobium sp. VK22B]